MRLSEFLETPEIKKRNIVVIGHYDTGETIFAVLARRGEKLIPVPKLSRLIENGPSNPDPEIKPWEVDSILRHFGFFDAISTFPPK